jgi:hypothetical protein
MYFLCIGYSYTIKLEKKYAPALDNYGQSCFVRSDLKKMKCVCKTQMMPPPDHQNPVDMHTSIIVSDHQNPVDMHTSIMCIIILQNIPCICIRTDERTDEWTDRG